MNFDPIYQEGDLVYYCGQKFKQELTGKEGKPQTGIVHARVVNQPGHWVIEFPDTKQNDSYIMSEKVLTKFRPAKTEQKYDGPEVQKRRKRASEDD
jgi:hypothetical protein